MESKSKIFSYKRALTSARKAGLLIPLIARHTADKALLNLQFNDKKASVFWEKLIKSAVSSFSNADASHILIEEAYVGPGTTRKTGRVGSRSRFKRILKRRAHLYIRVSLLEEKETPKKASKKVNSKEK